MSDQKFQILVQRGPEPGKIYPLSSVSITIGRDPMADITITDPEVSRQHVRLSGTLTGYTIQDLGSTNGTFVDGERLSGEAVELRVGQTITMGAGVALQFQSVMDDYDDMATMIDGSQAASGLEDQESQEIVESSELADVANETPISQEYGTDEPQIRLEAHKDIDELDPQSVPVVEDAAPIQQDASLVEGESIDNVDDADSRFIPDPDDEPRSRLGDEPVIIPHQGESEQIEPFSEENNWRTPVIIVSLVMLLVCCCCGFFLFLYYYGGDWLLRQMGLLA